MSHQEGYGRDIVDQFYEKNKLYKRKKQSGQVPAEWVTDRKVYKVGHKVGEASQLIVAKRFDEACDLVTQAIGGALGQGESPTGDRQHSICAACAVPPRYLIRSAVWVRLCGVGLPSYPRAGLHRSLQVERSHG